MTTTTISADIEAPIGAVWAVVSDFGGLSAWSRAVKSCRLEGRGIGCHRVVQTAAGEIRERLDECSDAEHRLAYSPVSGSTLPLLDASIAISLTPLDGERTRVDWAISGEPVGGSEEASAKLRTRYAERLAELSRALE